MRARRWRYPCAAARAVAVAGAAADGAIGPARCRAGIAIGRAGIAVCTAASAAIRTAPAVTGTATVRRRATVVSATAATTVDATATLRESSRRGKQIQSCEYREDNLETSGPIHGCTLHPSTS